MVSLRGADYIREIRKNAHDASRVGITDKRIICVRFRYEQRTGAWFRRGSRDATAGEEPRKVSSTTMEDDEAAAEDGDTVVFVLQVHDEAGESAFDNCADDAELLKSIRQPFEGATQRQPLRTVQLLPRISRESLSKTLILPHFLRFRLFRTFTT